MNKFSSFSRISISALCLGYFLFVIIGVANNYNEQNIEFSGNSQSTLSAAAENASEVSDDLENNLAAETDSSLSSGEQDSLLGDTTGEVVLPTQNNCVENEKKGNVIKISPSDNPTLTSAQKYLCIKKEIENAASGEVVEFASGDYVINPDVNIRNARQAVDVAIAVPEGVTVKGAGVGKTNFLLTNPKFPQLFKISPVKAGVVFKELSLQNLAPKGSTAIQVNEDLGDIVYLEIVEPNNVSYLSTASPVNLIARFGSAEAVPVIRKFRAKFKRDSVSRAGLVTYKVDTVMPTATDIVLTRNTIPHTFDKGAFIKVIKPITQVALQDFSITGNFTEYVNKKIDHSNFSNVANSLLVTNNSHAAILVDYGNETVLLKNISIFYPWSRAVEIKRSVGTKIRGITINGAYNKGGGGNGYGLTLSGSTNVDATGLRISNARHALLFNADDSEHFNFIKIADTNRDVNFHGLLDSGNVVWVGTLHQEYSPTANASWAAVHTDQSLSHVPTAPAENTVYFFNAYSSTFSFNGDPKRQNDRLFAAPAGGKIYGQLGNDLIIGNVGADSLYGGLGQDTVRGGGGNDFVSGGEDNDKVYGESGDDFVSGGPGDDIVDGGPGNDTIMGDNGKDILVGGPGSDVFKYKKLGESISGSADIIKDFSVSEDKIDLSLSGYTGDKLDSVYDGTYTILFTKNHKNVFELHLLGKVDLAQISFVPVTKEVTSVGSRSFIANVLDGISVVSSRFFPFNNN